MKILFVSPSFYPAFHYGGPTFINRSLCDALGKTEQLQVEVLTTDSDGPGSESMCRLPGSITVKAIRLLIVAEFCRRIFHCVSSGDCQRRLIARTWFTSMGSIHSPPFRHWPCAG